MKPKAILGVRISPPMKEQLAEVAKSQHRSSSSLVELLIKQYLEQIVKRSTPAKAKEGVAFPAAVEGTLGEWGTTPDDEAWNGL